MRMTYTVFVTGSAVLRAVAVAVRLGVRLGEPLMTSRVAVAASLAANAVRVAWLSAVAIWMAALVCVASTMRVCTNENVVGVAV